MKDHLRHIPRPSNYRHCSSNQLPWSRRRKMSSTVIFNSLKTDPKILETIGYLWWTIKSLVVVITTIALWISTVLRQLSFSFLFLQFSNILYIFGLELYMSLFNLIYIKPGSYVWYLPSTKCLSSFVYILLFLQLGSQIASSQESWISFYTLF